MYNTDKDHHPSVLINIKLNACALKAKPFDVALYPGLPNTVIFDVQKSHVCSGFEL